MIPLIDLSLDKRLSAEIKKQIAKVVDSKSYILGKELSAFEKKFANLIKVKEAIGVANGTDALRLCLRAMGIGRGDKVLTVAFTSPFTSVAITEEGATPVFCDIDEKTWTISPSDCVLKIDKSVKAIMPVHIYGNPADMKALTQIAKKYKLKIIEDACQAHLASFSGKKIGSLGDAAGFSFYPTKNLGGMGDGGIATTKDPRIAKKIRLLRHGGQTKRFWHEYRGINSRLDEIQAVILSLKLKQISKFNKKRASIVKKYRSAFSDLPITFQENYKDAISANHLCVIKVANRDGLHKYLNSKGIESGIYYPYGVHQLPAFSNYSKGSRLYVTEALLAQSLALPLSPNLSTKDQDFIIDKVRKFFKNG